VLALLASASIAAPGLLAEVNALSLYQKTARASVVARVRAESDSTRRPELQVLEIFKGSVAGGRVTIVPFHRNLVNDKPWLRPAMFRKGHEYLVFLTPYEPDRDEALFADDSAETLEEAPGPALFEVLNAHHGVMEIPAEGSEALASAVRRFSAVIVLHDYDEQSRRLRALLTEGNPYLVEAALQQVSEYRLARPEDVDALLSLLDSPRAQFRAGALRILGQLVTEPAPRGEKAPERARLSSLVIGRAFGDSDPEVRGQAVLTLRDLGGDDAADVLRRISRTDPDQEVRYRAEVALAEMTGAIPPPRHEAP
jgi:hypothetical protein